MNRMDEHDFLENLDWNRVYSDVPQEVSAGVQYAFMRIRVREKRRRMFRRTLMAAACFVMLLGVGAAYVSHNSDAPDIVAAPEVDVRVLSADERVYAARADDYFHVTADCPAAMAEQVQLQLVTALEFNKEKCSLCGAKVLLP